jgi:hypothetical protein
MAEVLAHPSSIRITLLSPVSCYRLPWWLVLLASSVVSQRQLNQSGSHRPNLRKILYVIAPNKAGGIGHATINSYSCRDIWDKECRSLPVKTV